MSDRIPCVVPGCGRTHKAKVERKLGAMTQWICADHWRAVDRRRRWLHKAIKRKVRKSGWTLKLECSFVDNWSEVVKQAIEFGVGL